MKEKIFLFTSIGIWIVFIILFAFYYQNYNYTKDLIIDKSLEERNLVEKNILHSLKYMNHSYKILGNFLNEEMRNISQDLVKKYKENPDIFEWNLEEIKSQYKDYEIYIIDRDLKVIRTTQKTDLGLDFNQFPNFARLLKKRMAGDSFVVDRMDISTKTQRLKKYSYIPTPDHNYLIELSIDIQKANPTIKKLNVFKHAQKLANNHKELNSITYYKAHRNASKVGAVVNNEEIIIDTDISRDIQKQVAKTLKSQKVRTLSGERVEEIVNTKYVPYLSYKNGNTIDWWNSYVVRLDYNNEIITNKISKTKNLFVFRISSLLFLFLIFNLFILYSLKKINRLSSLDPVTGISNRELFYERFQKHMKKVKRSNSSFIPILFIDINRFKAINDQYGHDVGDIVLYRVAQTLRNNLRKNDLVVRAGGDEFYVMLEDILSLEHADLVVQKLYNVFKAPFVINDYLIHLDISIGMSFYPSDGHHLKELIQKADHSMYANKNA